MTPIFDPTLWSHLDGSEQTVLETRLQSADAAIREAIDREARHRGRDPQIQFRASIARIDKLLGDARVNATKRWRKIAGITGLISLALALAVAVCLDEIVIASLAGIVILASGAAVAWKLRRKTVGTLTHGERDTIARDCTQVAVFDAETLHVYTLSPETDEVSIKRWDLSSLRIVSFGWPGLPGLSLANASRKTYLPLTVPLDGAGEHPLLIKDADAILYGLFQNRYSGTTQPELAVSKEASILREALT